MVVRGGRKRAFKSAKAYKLHLRGVTEERGAEVSDNPPGAATAQRCAWWGSKCYKGSHERRPHKGGKVHGQ